MSVRSGAHHPDFVLALAVVAASILLCGVLIARDRVGAPRRRPRGLEEPATRAAMTEISPEGWKARITVYGWKAPIPEDAPPARVPQVRLELLEYQRGDSGPRPVAGRRLWAASIADALAEMVEHRGNERSLEQPERSGTEE